MKTAPGYIVIFRQDLPHFGSGYVLDNFRYFAYIHHKGLTRTDNKTAKVAYPKVKGV